MEEEEEEEEGDEEEGEIEGLLPEVHTDEVSTGGKRTAEAVRVTEECKTARRERERERRKSEYVCVKEGMGGREDECTEETAESYTKDHTQMENM